MTRHFQEELEQVKEKVLRLGSIVAVMVENAVTSLVDRDTGLAEDTIASDQRADLLEVEIDDACIKLLALHQPTAGDLRFVTTAMKVSTDPERISDHATNIAEMVVSLVEGRNIRHATQQGA